MALAAEQHIVMGFYFFPRGGSAQVVRYLCRALERRGCHPLLFTGSLGSTTATTNAARFFADIACQPLDYTEALSDWRAGGDPMAATVPMHASYEDKPDVADRSFFQLDDDAFERQVLCWTDHFADAHTAAPDAVHLHHLTPMHAAARALWPDVPLITHLHGTELKMLAGASVSAASEQPGPWMEHWVARMRRWAADSDHIVVVSDHDAQLARRLLPLDAVPVTVAANGVDTDTFGPRHPGRAERMDQWSNLLVADPHGWRPGGLEGSVRYQPGDLRSFLDTEGRPVPVVLYSGRFLRFKRLQRLIEAHQAMRRSTAARSVLAIAGGFPGEWEDEHPYDTVRRIGAEDVFFLGWREHDELARILNCSDLFAAPAVDEPFGLTYLEAMASGVPPLATTTGGPCSFINTEPGRPTGWLVAPDDAVALAAALTEAVSSPAVRLERGRRAARYVRTHHSWAQTADAVAALYRRS